MSRISLALYQPDIAANVGAMMRLCACFAVKMSVIAPCGFVFDDKKLQRAGMDYRDLATTELVPSWDDFLHQVGQRRIVLMTTKGATPYQEFTFRADDILLMGRESSGVPPEVHERADSRVVIPMQSDARSLNIGMAASIALTEALRQTGGLPDMKATGS